MSAQIRKKNDRSKLVDQDYSRRMYAMADEGYLTVMKQTTQKYLDSVMLVKQSAWKKPYREDDYGTMEYKGDHGIPPIPVVGVGTSDCTPKGEAVGGGSHLCEDGISCGQWIFTCAHRIISFEVVQDFGWIKSLTYGENDTVTVTVCWNETDREAGRKIGPKALLANGKDVISTFDFGTCCPTTKACNGKCDGCPAPTIGYDSLQMSCGSQQILSHSGGGAGGKYTWSADYGTFNKPIGTTVIYTAPSANANCANNPTITLTDCCGHKGTVKFAVNCVVGGTPATVYRYDSVGPTGCQHAIWAEFYLCDGSYYTKNGCDSCGCGACANCDCGSYPQCNSAFQCTQAMLIARCTMAAMCAGSCTLGWEDIRTTTQKAAGCCPAQLL